MDSIRIIESYMGGVVRQVCPTRGPAGVDPSAIGKKRQNRGKRFPHLACLLALNQAKNAQVAYLTPLCTVT